MKDGNIVPVTIASRRSIATPSRQRRIVYDTARRLSKYYLEYGLDKYLKSQDAAIKVQASYRRFSCVQKYRRTLALREQSAISIQCCRRCYIAKKHVSILHAKRQDAAAHVLSNFSKRVLAAKKQKLLLEKKKEEKRFMKAVITVQKHIRSTLARIVVEALAMEQLDRECAATIIQTFVRTAFAKQKYLAEKYQRFVEPRVVIIQKQYRSFRALKLKVERMNGVERIQCWWRREKQRTTSGKNVQEKEDVEETKSVVSTSSTIIPEFEAEDIDTHIIDATDVSSTTINLEEENEADSIQSGSHSSNSSISSQSADTNKCVEDHQFSVFQADSEILKVVAKNVNWKYERHLRAIIIQRLVRKWQLKRVQLMILFILESNMHEAIIKVEIKREEQRQIFAAIKIQTIYRRYIEMKRSDKEVDRLYNMVMRDYQRVFKEEEQNMIQLCTPTMTNFAPNLCIQKEMHPDICNNQFLQTFLKHLPLESMPSYDIDLSGIDGRDSRSSFAISIRSSKYTNEERQNNYCI
ncbi:predicted protein [Chaetoceros tenuissimus]|uniref:Uncharacterized protein n=1 Tax=Chaetoceros tenuissimus TaxID=426638 RepID=A0AAD3GYE6_9STRA|nr:predicted protein [Chaetoceros tenuissimus]